jgi:hypothetical protein
VKVKVYKFPLDQDNFAGVPLGAEFLSVAMQNGRLTVWAIVDPLAETELRQFAVYGTGQELRSKREDFIGTVFDGPFVWHVFK